MLQPLLAAQCQRLPQGGAEDRAASSLLAVGAFDANPDSGRRCRSGGQRRRRQEHIVTAFGETRDIGKCFKTLVTSFREEAIAIGLIVEARNIDWFLAAIIALMTF